MIPFPKIDEIFTEALIRKVQVVIEHPTVGAAFSRDHLISRLNAAPTINTTCSFQITTLINIEPVSKIFCLTEIVLVRIVREFEIGLI